MPTRVAPYPSYNFIVSIDGSPRQADGLLGGFSEMSGLKTELHISEYREGNDAKSHVHKYAGVHTVSDVTLKRGVVNTMDFWDWITNARANGATAHRDVTITLRDEANNPVQKFKLYKALPKGYTVPTFNAKGTGDLAIEELVLAAEGLEISLVT